MFNYHFRHTYKEHIIPGALLAPPLTLTVRGGAWREPVKHGIKQVNKKQIDYGGKAE